MQALSSLVGEASQLRACCDKREPQKAELLSQPCMLSPVYPRYGRECPRNSLWRSTTLSRMLGAGTTQSNVTNTTVVFLHCRSCQTKLARKNSLKAPLFAAFLFCFYEVHLKFIAPQPQTYNGHGFRLILHFQTTVGPGELIQAARG